MSTPTSSSSGAGPIAAVVEHVSRRRSWSIVGLLFVASLINYLDRTTLSFALPDISKGLGLDATAKGTLLSAFFWSYALMQVPMGMLSDRVNLRWLYAVAFALWSLAQGFTGFAGSLTILIGFRVILGIGEAIYLPGGTKIVSLLFPPSQRGLPCGVFDSGTRAGMVLGGLLVPKLLELYGWRVTFAVIGFSALVWLVPWWMLTPKRMQAAIPEAAVTSRLVPSAGADWRTYRDLAGICLGFFCFDYYWFLLVTWLPDYLVTVRHLSTVKAGIYSILPFLVFGFGQPLGGWLADRLVARGWDETYTRKSIISLSFLTGLLLIPAAQSSTAESAVLLLMGACLVGLSTANQLVILQHCAPAAQVGLWTGIYNFVGNIAGALAPWITGRLIDSTGSYTPAFVLAAVMVASGQLSYWFLVGDLKTRNTASG